ncbi:restriction endonuclease subunit S [Candidatus Thiothrix anitrata]|uniref:Restriction endonuclease subunit S n=1 Tax=Candidatus Thiothrix anitrata TaxID=2823902 RepID=A0ABX7X5Q6_9GAMM|nr:restriction endonuclease subunit S [Candidatus Thiothrix anitrata]QTR50956.1 restriction endonuclease subunit S [Candidatus Thiothrix anitrata]
MSKLIKINLGDCGVQFIDGDRSAKYPKREEFVDSGVLFLNAESINGGSISIDHANKITEEKYRSIKKGRFKASDILLTTRGNGVGKAALVSKSIYGIINAQMLIIRAPSDLINPSFLYYYISSSTIYSYILNFSSGAAQPQIPIRDLKKIPIFLPPIETQNKIAAILSAYDELIENNQRRIALLEKMAEELYREWFVRFHFPNWQTAEFEKGIPKGWEKVSLSDIVEITMGQSPSSEFYNDLGNGLPFHQGVGTYGERFPRNEIYCSEKGRIAQKGDILFSVRAPVGRLNIASEKSIIGRGLSALRHKNNKQSYLFYTLKSLFKDEDIIGNGAIFNSVSKDELLKFSLLLPQADLINEFENYAQKIDKQIASLFDANKNLAKTKNMLLPRLISGKLPVDQLDIQTPPTPQKLA